ncbi:MAG: hypothetical protein M3Y54_01020 [Bacteroidota bacterium]|nr:hypothetical protein [Bacteroidota bacterium]
MRFTILLSILALQLFAGAAARAQCVALADLLAIGAEPTALASPKTVTDHLTFEWSYVGPTATAKEPSWTFVPSGTSTATALLVVRPQRPGQDVLLKTTQSSCVRELAKELKSRKLKPQPVTCPSCEAVRYQSSDFDVTLYSQMKGDYPFVVVVHQVPAGSPPAASNTKMNAIKNP